MLLPSVELPKRQGLARVAGRGPAADAAGAPYCSDSNSPAAPMPVPMHIVTMP
jgi:hypothetical protein